MSESQEWPLQLIVLPEDWYEHTLVFSIGNEVWHPSCEDYVRYTRDLGRALDVMRERLAENGVEVSRWAMAPHPYFEPAPIPEFELLDAEPHTYESLRQRLLTLPRTTSAIILIGDDDHPVAVSNIRAMKDMVRAWGQQFTWDDPAPAEPGALLSGAILYWNHAIKVGITRQQPCQ